VGRVVKELGVMILKVGIGSILYMRQTDNKNN
jgi:hypothetical protein